MSLNGYFDNYTTNLVTTNKGGKKTQEVFTIEKLLELQVFGSLYAPLLAATPIHTPPCSLILPSPPPPTKT